METEEPGRKSTCPAPDSEAAHQGEDQGGVEDLKRHARRVMTVRIESEELDVEHHREPGEGMPVSRETAGECPARRRPREPLLGYRVSCHIERVVVMDEAIVERTGIGPESGQGEAEREHQIRSSLFPASLHAASWRARAAR
jgi:hypothetical protein